MFTGGLLTLLGGPHKKDLKQPFMVTIPLKFPSWFLGNSHTFFRLGV